jgi:hypothetical protein
MVGPWKSLVAALLAILVTLCVGFATEIRQMSDYRARVATTTADFSFYVRRIADFKPQWPNQAMQLTASKPDVHAVSVCHPRFFLRRSHRRLAAADLGFR